MSYKLFLAFASSFLAGIIINNYFWNSAISYYLLLVVVGIFFVFFLLRKKYFFILCFLIIGLASGLVRSYFHIDAIEKNTKFLASFPQKSELQLEILGVKSIADGVTYKAELQTIEGETAPKHIFFETTIKSNFRLKKGEQIIVTAKIYPYKNTPEFRYKFFMLANNFYAKIYPYNHEIVDYTSPSIIEQKIISLREKLLSSIHDLYPKEEAIFLGGILLGAREEIPKALKTNFNNSGLTHFIAVSGFNITILIIFFSFFIKAFPSVLRFIIILIAVSFFCYLVGPSVAVVRASIMGVVGYLALTMGRKQDSLAIILLTAFVMTLVKPLSISYDVSFHLSFLAVVGIVYFQKYLDQKLSFIPDILELRTAVVLTLAALVLTFPIMIFSFGQISTPVLITNVLVSWTIPFAMLFGFISIIAYSFLPVLGTIIGFFAYVLLAWDIWVVNTFGSLSWSVYKVELGAASSYLQVLYLIAMSFVIISLQKRKKD